MTKQTDILRQLLPRLTRRARRLCRTADDADDLAQEVAVRLLQVLRGKTRIDTPDRYAMIMLHNLARQRWRQRREMVELSDDMALTDPEAPARLACRELRAAITRLPDDQALLMTLVQGGETSPQVLAAQTGVPLGTVMSRLSRARARLRADLGLDADSSVAEML
tara:strand:- start:124763 stop:125257 length:495 start_codon:yes stop_codon:yes gene_type:complete